MKVKRFCLLMAVAVGVVAGQAPKPAEKKAEAPTISPELRAAFRFCV